MKKLPPIVVAILLLALDASAEYLFTMPRSMEAGEPSHYCITVKGVPNINAIRNTIRFTDPNDRNNTVAEINKEPSNDGVDDDCDGIRSDWSMCDNFMVPAKDGKFFVEATIVINGDTLFTDTFQISIRTPDLITLVQTDKPIYKPGETVKFRALTMDYNLNPETEVFSSIYILSPSGTRMMEWKDVPADEYGGLVSLAFQLSDEPELGKWMIKYEDVIAVFNVNEYVLPKFEVTVTPPPYLLPGSPSVKGQVCAKYTYGKDVVGILDLEVCYESRFFYYRPLERSPADRPCVTVETEIKGCYEFNISSDDIQLGDVGYSWYGTLQIAAKVTEQATGESAEGISVGPSITLSPLLLSMEDDHGGLYRQGLPFQGRVIAKNPDGSPAANEEIYITATNYQYEYEWSGTFYTDENGVIKYAINDINKKIPNLNVKAEAVAHKNDWRYTFGSRYISTRTPTAYAYLAQFYSASDSFIYIKDIDEKVECDKQLLIDVYYNTIPGSCINFHGIVKAGDQVVYNFDKKQEFGEEVMESDLFDINPDTILEKKNKSEVRPVPIRPPPILIEESPIQVEEPQIVGRRRRDTSEERVISKFTLRIHVSESMAPDAQLLLYYIREDNEVVATSVKFQIKSCFRNPVKMEFKPQTVRPGADVNLHLEAAPSSWCFVGVVDKSINLIDGSNQLTPDQLFERVQQVARKYSYESYWQEDRAYCERKASSETSGSLRPGYYYYPRALGQDSIHVFRNTHMVTSTDLTLETRPCSVPFDYARSEAAAGSGGGEGSIEGAQPVAPEDEATEGSAAKTETQAARIRSFFPETWLWELYLIRDDGKFAKTIPTPHTITEWVGNALCTHPEVGVGLTDIVGVTTFQPFFLSLTLPYSAIRVEVVPVLATVFNYLSEAMGIKLELMESNDYQLQQGTFIRTFCLEGQSQVVEVFYVKPKIIGTLKVEVKASSIVNENICEGDENQDRVSDQVIRELLIEPEGIPQEDTQSFYVCGKDYSKGVWTKVDMSLPDNIVPGSVRAKVAVIGDIMGPALSNLDDMLRMPYGCGEQNAASTVVNLPILRYLLATGQATDEIIAKAKNFLQIGFQRQFKYRHNDYSYSAWGENQHGGVGSNWLTAFIVKSIMQSSEFIFIDMVEVGKSLNWLINTQGKDGCFPQVGRLASSYLRGGLNEENQVGLTAFILIALIQSNVELEHPAITSGFACLADRIDIATIDTYTVALTAYAFSLYNTESQTRADLMSELEKRKVEDNGLIYWKRAGDQPSPNPWFRYSSASVEMTAYALLAILVNKDGDALINGLPIVKWLSKQRNSYGGFGTTQDTVVGIFALAEYARLTYVKDSNLQIRVKANTVDHTFNVNDDNRLLYQYIPLPDCIRRLKYKVSGEGCALIQKTKIVSEYDQKIPQSQTADNPIAPRGRAPRPSRDTRTPLSKATSSLFPIKVTVKYNVFSLEDHEDAFDLQVHVSDSILENPENNINLDERIMTICVRYLKDGMSNMAIVEFRLPTGWDAKHDSLEQLVDNRLIERHENSNGLIELYLTEVGEKQICLKLKVRQRIQLDPFPSSIKIYDYYETHDFAVTDYSINNVASQNCPYCTEDIGAQVINELKCATEAVFYAVVVKIQGKYFLNVKSNLRRRQCDINEKVNYHLRDPCDCPILQKDKAGVLIFCYAKNLDIARGIIDLDKRTSILPYSKALEKEVKRCNKAQECSFNESSSSDNGTSSSDNHSSKSFSHTSSSSSHTSSSSSHSSSSSSHSSG